MSRTFVTLVALALVSSLAIGPAAADHRRDLPGSAAKAYDVALHKLDLGTGSVEEVHTWSVRWLTSQRDLPLKGRALMAAYQAHLARMTALASKVQVMIDKGQLAVGELTYADFFWHEAEAWAAPKPPR